MFAYSAEDAQQEGQFAGYVVPSGADSFQPLFRVHAGGRLPQ
ncbi:hypothetical protein QP028_15540 [Corynebacterium suedekumii]|nr:hypothetical protein QP028_15540 [Corynebacterium suedekumii]